jgi:hypothetical protein
MNINNILSSVRKALTAIENKITDLMFREKIITGRRHFRRNSVRIDIIHNDNGFDEETGRYTDSDEEWYGRFDSDDNWDTDDEWDLNRRSNRKEYCDMV